MCIHCGDPHDSSDCPKAQSSLQSSSAQMLGRSLRSEAAQIPPPVPGTPLDAWVQGTGGTLHYTPRPQNTDNPAPAHRTPITVNRMDRHSSDDSRFIGTVVGNFRIIERVGAGGMGTVYLGVNELIGSKVAVKVLHPSLAGDPLLVHRFHAEARAANLVGHENLVRIFDLNRLPDGGYCLVMEYLEGQPLSALQGQAMAPDRAIKILAQACQAVAAAHDQGVVHRDLKPENVFLIRNGKNDDFVKIVDFGIAKLRSSNTELTATGTITGTPEYMSPEQWLGTGLDHRVDIYALGVTAWAMLAGAPPFRGEPLALYAQHCTAPVPSLRARNPEVSEELERVIYKALEKNPNERWQDGRSMAKALKLALKPLTVENKAIPAQPAPPPAEQQFKARFVIQGQKKGEEPLIWNGVASGLTKGGVFVEASRPYPPLRSRGRLSMTFGRTELTTGADVVHLVSEQESAAWKTPAGFGIQFHDPSRPFLNAVNRMLFGETTQPLPLVEDNDVARLLREIEKRKDNAPYLLLALGLDAEHKEVLRRLRHLETRVAQSQEKTLPPDQKKRLDAAAARVQNARKAIGELAARAEYDAKRGNYRGVARCVAAGLRVEEMDTLRQRFLSVNAMAETTGKLHAISARAQARGGSAENALKEWESALKTDPLNLAYHREYWSLRRTCRS